MQVIVCLRDLLFEQIGDLYEGEFLQLKVLPLLYEKATSQELKEAITRLTIETAEHVVRLDRIFTSMQATSNGSTSSVMQSLVERTLALCDRCLATHVMDAALIMTIQQIIHYEIAAYGAACAFSNILNANELASLLYDTLEEVKGMDKLLSTLAMEKVNAAANVTTHEISEAPQILGVAFDGY